MRVQPAPGGALSDPWTLPILTTERVVAAPHASPDDQFERTAWLYAFLREHVFRDDTNRLDAALWPEVPRVAGTVLLEIGCGPGVYARQLAARHPGLRAVGIDRSPGLLRRAESLAVRDGIMNCWFEQGDALALDWPDASVDAVVASRLFTVVDGQLALAEMLRVLRSGGRCFVAEPDTLLDTLVPMAALRLVGWLFAPAGPTGVDVEPPPWPHRLTSGKFNSLIEAQGSGAVAISQERGYHFAVCQKPLEREG